MTQNLKIEVLTGDISIDGMVVTNLVTKEELSTAIVKKADLGTDGKIPTSQLPAEIVNTAGIVDEVKLQLETSIKDAVDESNAYAESYTDNALSSKADLESGKVPLEQLPSIDQYPQFGTSLNNLSTTIMKDVRARTDELEKTKASLGEDGKVLRELIPSYEKISGLPEQLEVMSAQTAAVSKELVTHKVQAADQIDVLKENIEANVQQLADRQSHLMRTYATKELGVDAKVGVKPGEYFYVRSTNEEEMFVEYQNVGGSAVATSKCYLSALGVELQEKAASTIKDASGKNQQDINYGLTDVSKLIELDPKASSNVYVQAYTPNGDKNGGGRFWHDETDSTTPVDNVYVFLSKTGKRWKRIVDGDVNVAMVGIIDSSAYQTEKLQALLDGCPDNKDIDFLGLTVKVDKELGAVSKWPEYSEKNDQPAVVLYNKNGVRLKNGKIKVDRHGLGAIDFCKSKNCKIAWSMKLEGSGLDKIPPIDRNSGYGEKGADSIGTLGQAGFYHPTLRNAPSTGYFRNNCLNTSGFTSNGYQGNFPQWGGGTAPTFGSWNGGYIGNYGMGLGIVESDDCGFFGESYGFNGSGVWLRSFDGFTIGFPAKLHDNYNAGYEVVSWTENGMSTRCRLKVRGAEIYMNGHPDASSEHLECDPGYGATQNHGNYPCEDVVISESNIYLNKRKQIDFHSIKKAFIVNNPRIDGYRGVSLSISLWNNKDEYLEVIGNNFLVDARDCPYLCQAAAVDFTDARRGVDFESEKSLDVMINDNNHKLIGLSYEDAKSRYTAGFTELRYLPKAVLTYGLVGNATCNNNIVELLSGIGEVGLALGINNYGGTPTSGQFRENVTCVGNIVKGKFLRSGIQAFSYKDMMIHSNTIDLSDWDKTASQLISDFGTSPTCIAISNAENKRNTDAIRDNVYITPFLTQSHSLLGGHWQTTKQYSINERLQVQINLETMTVNVLGKTKHFDALSPTITWNATKRNYVVSGLLPQYMRSAFAVPLTYGKATYSGSGATEFDVTLYSSTSYSFDQTDLTFELSVRSLSGSPLGDLNQPTKGDFYLVIEY